MITLDKGMGCEWFHCSYCDCSSFHVRMDDNGSIRIFCRKCHEGLEVGITKATHILLMEAKK